MSEQVAAPTRRQDSLLRFNAGQGASPDRLRAALSTLLSEDGSLKLSPEALAAAAGLPLDRADLLMREILVFDVQAEREQARKMGVKLIDCEDPAYPHWLKSTADAPLVLYVQGELPADAGAVAVVGSRRPTPYGLRMAAQLSGELSRAGLSIVSGLARGIDTRAHRAALAAQGRTWAVLGSGLDRVYPPENEGLAREIVESGGCLISELPFGTPPLSFHFPRRNRIISGLSWGTLVIEGRARSGSLITAHSALEQGREVFAVPGPADSPLSEAPHELITNGAVLTVSSAAILDTMPEGLLPRRAPEPVAGREAGASNISLSADQKKILECLGSETLTLDELSGMSGLPLPKLAGELFEMELVDVVSAVAGQRYAKKI